MNEFDSSASEPSDHSPCTVCRRPRCTPLVCRCDTRVCLRCLTTVDEQLAYLIPALRQLPLAQIPGHGGGEKVRTSKTAPLPLRVDPLSMTAAGRAEDEVRDAYVPVSRVWTERQKVTELTYVEGEPTYSEVERDVVHREPVLDDNGRRVLTAAGDQAGALPIVVWAKTWTTDWRATFGHAEVGETTPRLVHPGLVPAPQVGAAWVRTSAAREALIQHAAAIEDAARREIVRDVLGIGDARIRDGKRLDVDEQEPDPYAREWAIRYGQASESLTLASYVRYLRTWATHAADRHPDFSAFAAALATLVKTVKYVLGDIDDRFWLGRCPTGYTSADGYVVGRHMTDRASGELAVCGAGLWLEPFASQIVCPRCGTETGAREQLRLSSWIRVAWPVDRRRRYTIDEADAIQYATAGRRPDLRMPLCEHGRAVAVVWKRATERSDAEQMWRIADVGCATACLPEGRLAS